MASDVAEFLRATAVSRDEGSHMTAEVCTARLTAADDFGYEIDEAEIICWGRCPECVGKRGAT